LKVDYTQKYQTTANYNKSDNKKMTIITENQKQSGYFPSGKGEIAKPGQEKFSRIFFHCGFCSLISYLSNNDLG
jgi:hypothetical protein